MTNESTAKIIHNLFNKKTIHTILKSLQFESIVDHATPFSIKRRINNWCVMISTKVLVEHNEISLQDSFINDIFGKILDYKPVHEAPYEWNIFREKKTITDATRSDAAIGYFSAKHNDVRGIIELKDANTNLDAKQQRHGKTYTPVEQAFLYAGKFTKKCKWIIVSNYKEIRLYNRSASMNEYESFFIENLKNDTELKRFLYLLSRNNLIEKNTDSIIDNLYQSNEAEQETISKAFYNQYKQLRIHVFEHLKQNNNRFDDLTLLEKTQKLLDRFVFICFCEDLGLLPDQIFIKMMAVVDNPHIFAEISRWEQLRQLFRAIDQGSPPHHINKFNGGLFEFDEILDKKLVIGDVIFDELSQISNYDFDSELNVNVLGHIFEQSISDIEEIKSSMTGEDFDKKKGKRKKDGIFYTPESITRYIVYKAIGGWLEDRKKELGFYTLPELVKKDFDSIKYYKKSGTLKSANQNIKAHLKFWQQYKEKLSHIKILDPACGSGAFLNQAFDYLYNEGQYVNSQVTKLLKGQIELFRLDVHILKNNLFGVDLNAESVEITKLSLWLKTANRHSELTALDDNIKCGNSLIDDSEIDRNKSFNWNKAFPEIMSKGGFDVVIGNPPYVPSRRMSEDFKRYYYQKYITAEYQLNTFGLFLEKSLQLIHENAYYSLIVPNYWLFTRYDEKLREHLLIKHHVLEILNVFHVFEDATVDTLIITGMKQNTVQLPHKTNLKSIDSELTTILERLMAIQQHKWHIDRHVLFDKNSDTRIHLDAQVPLSKQQHTLSDFFMFKQGMKPYEKGKGTPPQTRQMMTQKVYDATSKIDETYEPLLRARNIKRFTLLWENDWIKYGQNLAAPRTKSIFEGERILVRRIISGDKLDGLYLSDPFINNTDIINILPKNNRINVKSFAAIVMSSLCAAFLKKQNINLNRKAFPKINVETLKTFPVPEISENQHHILAQKIDIMHTQNKKFQTLKKEFLTFLNSELKPNKISKKLENWHELDWDGFKNELTKCKVNLKKASLKERKEWQSMFFTQKESVLKILSIIYQTDRDIDTLVYELYDVSKITKKGGLHG